jgi:serine/threonine protein kinase
MTDIKQYDPLWGSWHVDSLIGEGSFGKVYKIRKEEFGKAYYSAVKIISIPQSEADLRQMRSEGLDDASARSYFHAFVADIIQEIDLMSAFRGNSNIVSFEDHKVIEKKEGIGWDILIRMELLTSLSEHVTNKALSKDEILKLGIHICRALELCALKNTIHRDIKPDNIFVSEYGEYKLGDFGIARQIERTMSGLSKKGTYTYMAPEVFKGDEYGASVDMYSLGIVMYRFLNQNRTPFLPDFPAPITPRDRDEAMQRRMKGEALPSISGIDPSLSAIVLKACAYDRRTRFASATEMKEALEKLVGGSHGYAPATGSVPIATPLRRVVDNERTVDPAVAFGSANDSEQTLKQTVAFKSTAPSEAQPEEKTSGTEGMFTAPKSAAYHEPKDRTERTEGVFVVPPPTASRNTSVPIVRSFFKQNITNEKLSNIVRSGEIPANVTGLDLFCNQISNIAPLASFIGLTWLYLRNNQISDIRMLIPFADLRDIDLGYNRISNIRPLISLTRLTVLDLEHNQISDIAPLTSLVALTWLDVSNNQINDVRPLSSLTNLEWLDVRGNRLTRKQINDLQKALPNANIMF